MFYYILEKLFIDKYDVLSSLKIDEKKNIVLKVLKIHQILEIFKKSNLMNYTNFVRIGHTPA